MKKHLLSFLLLSCFFLASCSESSDEIPTGGNNEEQEQPTEEVSPGDIAIEGDIAIIPTSGTASEAQSGQGIELSYDGKTDPSTHYHSRWGDGTVLPVTLEYFFEDKGTMDYIIYHTRNGNGNFGEFDLYIATANAPEYTLYGSYDFKMQNAPSRIVFKESLRAVTQIKFVVKTGLGGFVSCSEMQFFRKNTAKTLDAQLLTVFTDLTCSELKAGVTDEAIGKLPAYFGKLATIIRDKQYSDYEKEFRIQAYQPYSNPEEWADKLMTKKYSETRRGNPAARGRHTRTIHQCTECGRRNSTSSRRKLRTDSCFGRCLFPARRSQQDYRPKNRYVVHHLSCRPDFAPCPTYPDSHPRPMRRSGRILRLEAPSNE